MESTSDILSPREILRRRRYDILRYRHIREGHADLHGQPPTRSGNRHDDQQIHIALRDRVSPSMGAEQDNPVGMEAIDDPVDHIVEPRSDRGIGDTHCGSSIFHFLVRLPLHFRVLLSLTFGGVLTSST